MRHRQPGSADEGMVMVTVLLTLVFLLAVVAAGATSMRARNERLLSEVRQHRALLAAESGADDAIRRAAIGAFEEGVPFTGTSSAASTYVVHPHRFDKDGLDNDGDGNIDELDENVLQMTAQGRFSGARHTLRLYLGTTFDPPRLGAAVTILGTPKTYISGSARITGENTNPDGSRGSFTEDVLGVGVLPPSTLAGFRSGFRFGGAARINGVGGTPSIGNSSVPLDLNQMVADMRESADIELTTRGVRNADLGTLERPTIAFCDGDLRLTDVSGAGVLVVTGDLFMAGKFEWRGMVIVLGDFVGAGGANIYGGLIQGPNAENFVMVGDDEVNYSQLGLTWVPDDRYNVLKTWHDTAHSAIGSGG